MKKRILSLALTAILIFGLCACSASAAAPSGGSTAPQSVAAAAVSPPTPGAGSTAASQPGEETAPAAFERARLWDATLDAVVADFAAATAQTMMGGGQNTVYSPVSVYLTLGTLTDGASGDTHAQLMDVLGATAPGDALPYREIDDFFWQAGMYSGDAMDALSPAAWAAGANSQDASVPQGEEEPWVPALQVADSVWLGEGRAFRDSFVTNAENNWYAEVYGEVPFGTPEADEAFNTWVSEATAGRVQPEYETSTDTALLAASAAYLKDGWLDEFDPAATQLGTFTLADGTAAEASFMNRSITNHGYHQGEGYLQTVQFLSGGAEMHFILPDEGTTAEDLLADPAAVSAMLRQQYKQYEDIRLSLPLFQFTSEPPVADAVKAMGATDAFDPQLADFSGMQAKDADTAGLYLSNLEHQAFIGVNENGVEAAAVTIGEVAPTAVEIPKEEMEITFDRPFLFFIRLQGMPLFMGVVQNPVA